jgi:hypothetical protein
MGLNFPSSPALNQRYQSGLADYIYDGAKWKRVEQTALTKNRVVNGALILSQENGSLDQTSATVNWYVADQWYCNSNTPGSLITTNRHDFTVYNPCRYAIQVYAYQAKPTLASGEYFQIIQYIEGLRMADFQWGTAQAKSAVLRFSVMTGNGATGTFSLKLANHDESRSFLAPFTIPTAGVWHEIIIPIPGDTTGTWKKDNGIGMQLVWFPAANLPAGVPGWQVGPKWTLPGQSNLFTAVNNAMYLGNFGLYLDPLGTGRPPPWETLPYVIDRRECQRYWFWVSSVRGVAGGATQANRMGMAYPVQMRTAPSVSLIGAGNLPIHDGGAGGAVTSILTSYPSADYMEMELGVSGGLTALRAAGTYWTNSWFVANARL